MDPVFKHIVCHMHPSYLIVTCGTSRQLVVLCTWRKLDENNEVWKSFEHHRCDHQWHWLLRFKLLMFIDSVRHLIILCRDLDRNTGHISMRIWLHMVIIGVLIMKACHRMWSIMSMTRHRKLSLFSILILISIFLHIFKSNSWALCCFKFKRDVIDGRLYCI